jgi:hypothetical protein
MAGVIRQLMVALPASTNATALSPSSDKRRWQEGTDPLPTLSASSAHITEKPMNECCIVFT